mmetsp:Transcript_18662/g.60858  ORF Transcript_18662/g.60858 Transcript_18662/m.60858 type:complete len:248 (+) Transcript_18662:1038-1781(+)
MTTSPARTSRVVINEKSSIRFSSVRCENRKLALTALLIVSSCSGDLAGMLLGGSHSSSSSAIVIMPVSMAARFALERARRTGRDAELDAGSPPEKELCRRAAALPGERGVGFFVVSLKPFTWITTIVMSSVRVSYCSQSRYDSATTASAASSGSLNLDTMSTTVCDGRNSNTPSEASTRNSTPSWRSWIRISGSATTPMRSAAKSPIERVKAVPGYMPFAAHRRGGSPSSSSSFPQHCTFGSLSPSS